MMDGMKNPGMDRASSEKPLLGDQLEKLFATRAALAEVVDSLEIRLGQVLTPEYEGDNATGMNLKAEQVSQVSTLVELVQAEQDRMQALTRRILRLLERIEL